MTESRPELRGEARHDAHALPRSGELLWAFDSHDPPDDDRDGLVLAVAFRLSGHHLRQWDAENASRDPHVGDHFVAATKRAIDALNAARVGMVELIDSWAAAHLGGGPPEAPLHTETLGSVIDRLAVAWVRARRLAEVAQSAGSGARSRVRHASRQLAELGDAYDDLVREVTAGRRRMPHWTTLKHYRSRA